MEPSSMEVLFGAHVSSDPAVGEPEKQSYGGIEGIR